jgi:hypothetical protein
MNNTGTRQAEIAVSEYNFKSAFRPAARGTVIVKRTVL